MSGSIVHTAESRGTTNLGWLHCRHTFSFGNYFNDQRVHFGALRVINDELIAPGKGYGTHPHSNMEIITIPLEGKIEHKDDLNNQSVISKGSIQVLSAGTGVFHSETNSDKSNSAHVLQIWIVPQLQKLKPRYSVKQYKTPENEIVELVSLDRSEGKTWIYQNAWLGIGSISDTATLLNYKLNKPGSNGVYVFVLSGQLIVDEQCLNAQDGMGLWDIETIAFQTQSTCEFLIIEIPLKA